ncbi:MAG: MerR family transcriptional regulator [Bacteroidales bacterium]|nr:MerR family transcriptional regulator [Bacteroidales bacterium]MBS3775230.1 MerR family transcriptional regulator [Bacteroidales bacterium]
MSRYSIKELEKLSGIKAHTIRIWEKRYNVIQPKRTQTNIRYYSEHDLKKLLNIAILNREGRKISDISKLNNHELTEKVMRFTYNSINLESQIEKLVIAMVELDETKFDQILSNAIMHEGFEQTIIKLIFPFLARIGLLWQTGSINPAQEHFISNLLRQKIMVAIDNLRIPDRKDAKTFILFLPEDEFHELGLLFYNYLIKKAGQNVIYLGSSVPFSDLVETNQLIKSDYLFTAITTALSGNQLKRYIEQLSDTFSRQIIFIAGMKIHEADFSLPGNVEKVFSPSDIQERLKSI